MEDDDEPTEESEYLDEGSPQCKFGSAFSYYESIHEFNQVRYGGASYSIYQLGRHLLNLIFSCRILRGHTKLF